MITNTPETKDMIMAERNILALLDTAFQQYIQLPMGAFDTDSEAFKGHILLAQKIILSRIGVITLSIPVTTVPVVEPPKEGVAG